MRIERASKVNAKDLFAMKVIEADYGTDVGTVEALLIDADEISVKAIGITGAGRLGQSRYVDLSDVMSVGKEAITIPSEDMLKDRKMYVKERFLDYLLDRPVVTEDGKSLGEVRDYTLNPDTGQIQSITVAPVDEILGGLIESVDTSKMHTIPRRFIKSIRENVTVDSSMLGADD